MIVRDAGQTHCQNTLSILLYKDLGTHQVQELVNSQRYNWINIIYRSMATQVNLLLVGYHSEACYWSASVTNRLTFRSERLTRASGLYTCVYQGESYNKTGFKLIMVAVCFMALLLNASSCAQCTVRSYKPKCQGLEQRKVYCRAMHGDR